jgi:cysteine desulfurase
LEPSYVLRAIGSDDVSAHSSIRFGIGMLFENPLLRFLKIISGRFTTEEEINFAIELCEKHVGRLREMSPLWEMVQEGIDLKTIQWTQGDDHH